MAFRIVGVKKNYSTKEIVFWGVFLVFFGKGGAHAPVAPPPPGYGLAIGSNVFPVQSREYLANQRTAYASA